MTKNNNQQKEWEIASTATTARAYTIMEVLQKEHLSRIWSDVSGIGKTATALHYQRYHKNVGYVDCSQGKTRAKFIRAIAAAFGVNNTGKVDHVYADMVDCLKTSENPFLIIDEAGDLNYNAFLEIKAIWNAVNNDQYNCGFLLMGANGLKAKIERLRDNDKVGYEEILNRFGTTFMRFCPKDAAAYAVYFNAHAEAIAAKNAPGVPLEKLMEANDLEKKEGRKTINTLRRLRDNIVKHQTTRK